MASTGPSATAGSVRKLYAGVGQGTDTPVRREHGRRDIRSANGPKGTITVGVPNAAASWGMKPNPRPHSDTGPARRGGGASSAPGGDVGDGEDRIPGGRGPGLGHRDDPNGTRRPPSPMPGRKPDLQLFRTLMATSRFLWV